MADPASCRILAQSQAQMLASDPSRAMPYPRPCQNAHLKHLIVPVSVRSQVSTRSESDSSQNTTLAQSERQSWHHPRFSYEQNGEEEQHDSPHTEQQKTTHTALTQYAPIQTTDGDDSPEIKSTQALRRRPAASLASWAWECSAVCIAIASFISIIVILRVYENRLLSAWGAPLTINAVVSILTTLFKGALALPIAEGISQLKWRWFSKQDRDLVDLELYDQASRGPWGSIILLLRQVLHKQRSYLAAFGALVLLLLLAVDSFSQAAVGYYDCVRNVTEPASIPVANSYRALGRHITAGVETIEPAMSAAIQLGFLRPPTNSSASIGVSCATGNCTFPTDQDATFTTLSMNSFCVDLTTDVIAADSAISDGLDGYYTLPNGLTVGPSIILNISTSNIMGGPAYPWINTTLWNWQGLATRMENKSCDPMNLLCQDFSCQHDPQKNCSSVPFAFGCALEPVAKTYVANVTKGVYTETELVSVRAPLHLNPVLSIYEVALNRTVSNGAWKNCTFATQNTTTHTYQYYGPDIQEYEDTNNPGNWYLANGSVNGTAQSVWYEPECVYTVEFWGKARIPEELSRFVKDASLTYVGGGPDGPPWLLDVYNDGNINMDTVSAQAEGLANAIGAQFRTAPANPGYPEEVRFVTGQAQRTNTCIRVQWGFLSYPGMVLVLVIGFLGALVAMNHLDAWSSDWKSSTLAVVFRAGMRELGEENSKFVNPKQAEMRDVAKSMRVRLVEENDGWRLVQRA